MLNRVVAALVLTALAIGPWLRWPCAHSCVPERQGAAIAADCHGGTETLPRLAAEHHCGGHEAALTVVAKRTESVSASLSLPGAKVEPAAIGRAACVGTPTRLAASPPSFSRVIPLRI